MLNYTIESILRDYSPRLQSVSDTPKLNVECLLCHVLNVTRVYLYTWSEMVLTKSQQNYFDQIFMECLSAKPIAYIIGQKEFWGMTLNVNESTLIPRPDTEVLVEIILSKKTTHKTLDVLDLGTGSGAIALALASEKPSWKIMAVDFCGEALKVAKQNAQQLGFNTVKFLQSNWYQKLAAIKFDVIVSNPPYINQNDSDLCEHVRRYEPMNALISENNGLADIEKIISLGGNYLVNDGLMIVEHGYQQAMEVASLYQQYGYQNIEHHYDLAGHQRATSAIISVQNKA